MKNIFTSNEKAEAQAAGCGLWGYAMMRKRATHAEALEAHAAGCDLCGYAEARERATHAELMAKTSSKNI